MDHKQSCLCMVMYGHVYLDMPGRPLVIVTVKVFLKEVMNPFSDYPCSIIKVM